MKPWYVWLLGRHVTREDDGEIDWAVVGIYSSKALAEEAAESGDWIATFSVDDTATEQYPMAVEIIP